MVQRKVPTKLGIKPRSSDTDLVNLLRPSSPQALELKKIMKKPRTIKRPFHEDGGVAQIHQHNKIMKKSRTIKREDTPQKQSPNYMKSTTSFEARKERSEKSKTQSVAASGHKGSRPSSLKLVRSPSFKPSRPSSKTVILCDNLDAQRATCSSTLKDSKFPDYLQLSDEGTSAMKVCPYSYCSLNGHHHAPLPPLRCFLSARRRAMKTQKGFKLGCLSPRQTKQPVVKKNKEIVEGLVIMADEAPEEVDMKPTPMASSMEEEGRDFFIEIYSKDGEDKGSPDLECSDIDWEEGYSSASCPDDEQTFKSQETDGDLCQEKIQKTDVESLYGELQESYDEESVSSGGWSDDSESESSYQQTKISNHAFEVSSTMEADVGDKMDEDKIASIIEGIEAKKDQLRGLPIGDQNITCSINYQQEETSHESKTIPDFAENSQDRSDKHHTTIIYNIIHINISVFVNGEKTEHSETDKGVAVQVPATAVDNDDMETEEVTEAMVGTQAIEMVDEQGMNTEDIESNQQLNASCFTKNQDNPEKECSECEACSQSNSIDSETDEHLKVTEQGEITADMDTTKSSLCKERASNEEQPEPSINLRGSTRGKKPDQDIEDTRDFNPRGPNFLPEIPDPDAETVDLRHQMVDERKNAEEWMVDFALQQAVTTLAPARKRKVALLVEAFEKVMPIPKYDIHNRHTSKAFTNARPMQACS